MACQRCGSMAHTSADHDDTKDRKRYVRQTAPLLLAHMTAPSLQGSTGTRWITPAEAVLLARKIWDEAEDNG